MRSDIFCTDICISIQQKRMIMLIQQNPFNILKIVQVVSHSSIAPVLCIPRISVPWTWTSACLTSFTIFIMMIFFTFFKWKVSSTLSFLSFIVEKLSDPISKSLHGPVCPAIINKKWIDILCSFIMLRTPLLPLPYQLDFSSLFRKVVSKLNFYLLYYSFVETEVQIKSLKSKTPKIWTLVCNKIKEGHQLINNFQNLLRKSKSKVLNPNSNFVFLSWLMIQSVKLIIFIWSPTYKFL